jgi:hypothetical protein
MARWTWMAVFSCFVLGIAGCGGNSDDAAKNESDDEIRASDQANALETQLDDLAIAMQNVEGSTRYFPSDYVDGTGTRLLSWRVRVLPFLGERELFEEFELDEPWDSPHNIQLVEKMPPVFQSPDVTEPGKTTIMRFMGDDAPFGGAKATERRYRGLEVKRVVDGMRKTVFAVVAGPEKAVPWTKPVDLPFLPEDPAAALGKPSQMNRYAVIMLGWSVNEKRVKWIYPETPAEVLRAIITYRGDERVAYDEDSQSFKMLDRASEEHRERNRKPTDGPR